MLIDTNILIRFIFQDHAELSQKATDIIVDNKVICLNEVVYESIHVLTKVYHIPKNEVAQTLIQLFEKNVVQSSNTVLTIQALTLFLETSMDFVDCLMIAYHIIHQHPIQSFDKKVNNYLIRWKQQHGN